MQGHIDAWCIPSRTTGVPGIETYAEEGALIQLALAVPEGGVIVELGGEYGRSASQFAYALKLNGHQSAKVFTVDLFPTNHWYVGDLRKTWQANLEECKLDFYCTAMRGDTAKMAKTWGALDDKDIDLLFIDAGHSYLEVKADIENWLPFVKAGGVVAFHDYANAPDSHPLHFEVKRAVDEWWNYNRGWVREGQVDSLIWFSNHVEQRKLDDFILAVPAVPIDAQVLPRLTETINTTPTVAVEQTLPPTVKNKGGRPKGSGTKPKATASK